MINLSTLDKLLEALTVTDEVGSGNNISDTKTLITDGIIRLIHI